MISQPSLLENIEKAQREDPLLQNKIEPMKDRRFPEFNIDHEVVHKFHTRLCVPSILEINKELMDETHRSTFSIHFGRNKMCRDLHDHYWWDNMKRDIGDYMQGSWYVSK